MAIALIALANAASWALITPAFNAPDEPDHFAYAQYFAETGHAPERVPGPRPPYSTDQTMALNAVNVFSQIALPDGRPPWLGVQQSAWEHEVATTPHPAGNGGGYTTAAAPHQPAYYALLAPAYLAVSSQSIYSQLTAMRLVSALLGALVALCAFGVIREVLPRQPTAALAAGLLVTFQPMFGFISGAVNNDNGINAAAALALYLTIRALRRGLTWRIALALGATLAVAPLLKETGYEIYPAVAVGLLGMAWRRHRLRDTRAWAALAAAFLVVREGWSLLQPVFYPPVAGHAPGGGIAASERAHHRRAGAGPLRGVPVGAVPAAAVVHGRPVPARAGRSGRSTSNAAGARSAGTRGCSPAGCTPRSSSRWASSRCWRSPRPSASGLRCAHAFSRSP